MRRLLVTIPLAGGLVLAIGTFAPGVVGDLVTGRDGGHTAYELRAHSPHCWSIPYLSYCRVDYDETVSGAITVGSLHFLLTAPLPERVSLVRSDRPWVPTTTAQALGRLRERAGLLVCALALLALVVWRMLAASARRLIDHDDVAARMRAAGWTAATPEDEAAEHASDRTSERRSPGAGFGRRR